MMLPSRKPAPLRTILAVATALALSASAGAADLMDAYELARTSDPQLGATEARRAATAQNVTIARSNLLPQIGAEASLTDSDGDSAGLTQVPNPDGSVSFGPSAGSSDTRARNYGLSVSQSIYDRSNYTSLDASRARSLQAGAELAAANDLLMLRVAEAYFNVLTAIDSVVFARAEERAVGRQLDQAEQRFEVGLTAITDVHEARARFDQSRAGAILAENTLNDAREALAEITGEYLQNLRGVDPEFKPELPEPSDVAAWVATALEQNPVLDARELALIAAGHDVSTAKAGHLPTLSATASYGDRSQWGTTSSNDFDFPALSSSDGTTVGVTLRVPIFSGFATSARVRQSIFLRDAVSEELDQQRRAITRQTRTTYRTLVAGISEIAARQQGLVSAQSALEATEAGFEVGTRTIVDVLLSQQVLFQAQRDYSTARHNFLVNTLRLKQSAGTIGVDDIKQVNRLLVRDAEAPLVAPEEADPQDRPAGLQLEEAAPVDPADEA